MANLSDADVVIEVDKVSEELNAYIKLVNAQLTDYTIVSDGYDESIDESGNHIIRGNSSGRWAYSNNLEGYFDKNRVKSWLGLESDYEWAGDNADKYKQNAERQYEAYLALVEAIKNTDGSIDIDYTDCDPAMEWMGSGVAKLELVDGEVVFSQSFEEQDFNISSYAEMQGETEYWALEYLYGDEVAEAFDKYLEECRKNGREPESADDWYDNIHEQE